MKSIQQIIDSGNSKIDIPMGEYEGPLRIHRSCTIDGHGATLWSKGGTALIVDSAKVTINGKLNPPAVLGGMGGIVMFPQ